MNAHDLFDQFRLQIGIALGVLLTALGLAIKGSLQKGFDFLLSRISTRFGDWWRFRVWEKKYRAHVFEEHRYLKFVGVKHSIALARPNLRDAFIDLELQTSGRVVRTSGDYRTVGLGETYTLDGVIERFRCIAVLGNPGAGKTTLLEYVASTACHKKSEISELLPIYVPLRRCSFRQKSLLEQLKDRNTGLMPVPLLTRYPEGFFENRMGAGKCILLFDGLDEVLNDEDHVAAARMVETTSVAFPKCPIIVSSRLAGWRDLLGNKFACFVVRELSRRDINGLVRRWFHAVVREEVRTAVQGTMTKQHAEHAATMAEEKAEHMLKILNSAPRLLQIATTPLILSLMCLVYYTQQNLPRRRAELYEECAVILLDEWDKLDKQLHHAMLPSFEDKVRLLEYIALYYFEAGISELRREELLKVITANAPETATASDAQAILKFIEERSGIVSEKGPSVYAFTHLTLQEYFTARGLRHRDSGLVDLLNVNTKAEVLEVVLLYSGLIENSDKLVTALLNQYADGKDIRFLAAAGRAAAEAREIGAHVKMRTINMLVAAFEKTPDARLMETIQPVLADLGIQKEIVRSFGDFDVGAELGRGGNGTVYLAKDKSSGQSVALKVLNSFPNEVLASIQTSLAQLRELDHCNLAKIFHFGRTDNQFFISMQYIAGSTVDRIVQHLNGLLYVTLAKHEPELVMFKDEPIKWGESTHFAWALAVIRDVCTAAEFLHARKLLHMDIKASNVMWTGERAILLDFGIDTLIAKAKRERELTVWSIAMPPAHSVFGTPAYMSPEQLAGKQIDARSDIYSIGAMFSFLLTGQRETFHSGMWEVKKREFQKAVSIQKRFPMANSRLENLVRAMLAADPNDRPHSATDVLRELDIIDPTARPC